MNLRKLNRCMRCGNFDQSTSCQQQQQPQWNIKTQTNQINDIKFKKIILYFIERQKIHWIVVYYFFSRSFFPIARWFLILYSCIYKYHNISYGWPRRTRYNYLFTKWQCICDGGDGVVWTLRTTEIEGQRDRSKNDHNKKQIIKVESMRIAISLLYYRLCQIHSLYGVTYILVKEKQFESIILIFEPLSPCLNVSIKLQYYDKAIKYSQNRL